ncbi:protein AMBP [Rhinichthys klamathensis goyatoka]|uniref:protein AMBP n=1 Tax=Rhinichthys klamathensis goyatoka TaxID=3034132 RepID=UPI0024B5CB5D|nr:protein AMBP [Rhinichthys klamathensis goyatoka]
MMRVVLVFLLSLLGLLHAGPLPDEPVLETQENFDVKRFMGKWYGIATASTCPWLKRHKGEASIGSMELQQSSDSTQTISMTRISLRHGTCKSISGEYQLTKTPGRFHYHNAKWNADVDTYVVHTNYDEYALVVTYKQKTGGEKSTSVKLYGRSMQLRPTLIEDFKTLVAEQGMSDDTIVIKKNKGECVPGEPVTPEPQIQRARRNVVVAPPEEGSGDDTPMFRGPEACKSEPDSGPCFGMMQRFHYNSSIMTCQMFTYGGCMGNQNNFVTEKECLQSCRTEAACRLPMDDGPCRGSVDLWAFDSSAGKCVSFKYGGCKGNGNKFYSQKECEEYCGVMMRNGDDEFLTVN